MTARHVRDFTIYVSIAIAVVLLILWGSIHNVEPGVGVIAKWGGLAVNTLIVFGYTIRNTRPSDRSGSFWVLMLLLLVLHLGVFTGVLLRLPEWRTTWWAVVISVEYFLIGSLVVLVGRRSQGNRRTY